MGTGASFGNQSACEHPMPRLHLVFDLDDTLYPERQFAISGFRACEQWLEQNHGVTGVVDDMTRLLDAGHMRSLFEITLEKSIGPYDEAQIKAFIDVYRLHPPEIALYDDAHHALDHFESLGPIGLITDGQEEVQSSKVRALTSSTPTRSAAGSFPSPIRDRSSAWRRRWVRLVIASSTSATTRPRIS